MSTTGTGLAASAPPEASVAEYREAMSDLAAGVAVLTARDTEGRPRGLTVSSLASHSIDPPTVLASLGIDTRTYAAIATTRRFAVHLLTDEQRSVAEAFATPRSDHKFELVDWSDGNGLPIIDGVLAVLRCEIADTLIHGDHAVVLGEVGAVDLGDGRPLVHVERGYWSLG